MKNKCETSGRQVKKKQTGDKSTQMDKCVTNRTQAKINRETSGRYIETS